MTTSSGTTANAGVFGDGGDNTDYSLTVLNDMINGLVDLTGICEQRYSASIENVLEKSKGGDVIPSLAEMMAQSGNMIKFTGIIQLLTAQVQTLSRVAQSIASRAGS